MFVCSTTPSALVYRKGANRHLNLWKPAGKATLSDVQTVSLNSASQTALSSHFQSYPATDEELAAAFAGDEITVASAAASVGGADAQASTGAAPWSLCTVSSQLACILSCQACQYCRCIVCTSAQASFFVSQSAWPAWATEACLHLTP